MKYLFSLLAILFAMSAWVRPAQASLIVQRPNALGLTNGLVGYWPFEGNTMSRARAFDASGNGNHGNLTDPNIKILSWKGLVLHFHA